VIVISSADAWLPAKLRSPSMASRSLGGRGVSVHARVDASERILGQPDDATCHAEKGDASGRPVRSRIAPDRRSGRDKRSTRLAVLARSRCHTSCFAFAISVYVVTRCRHRRVRQRTSAQPVVGDGDVVRETLKTVQVRAGSKESPGGGARPQLPFAVAIDLPAQILAADQFDMNLHGLGVDHINWPSQIKRQLAMQ